MKYKFQCFSIGKQKQKIFEPSVNASLFTVQGGVRLSNLYRVIESGDLALREIGPKNEYEKHLHIYCVKLAEE